MSPDGSRLGDQVAERFRLVGAEGWRTEGTTRMGTDPTASVVDPDLRLHGHRTVFVVGAGPFPTTGTANPTLTVAALSLRAVGPIRASLTEGG